MVSYNINLEKLCKLHMLGTIINEPQELFGGLMHRVFFMQTSTGKYVIKAVNPQITARHKANENIINSEKICCIMSEYIHAVPSKIYGNKTLHEIDGQNYLVYDWCDGKNIFGDGINVNHCEEIGRILAIIHSTDFTKLGLVDDYTADEPVPDWNSFLEKGIIENVPWVNIVSDNIVKLYTYSNQLCVAAKILSANTVISHCDLEPKNVLWNNNIPYVIDWEAAGFINPMHDLIETAAYWSKNNNGLIIKNKFLALIKGYKSIIPNIKEDWNVVLNKGFSSLIGWLEYSFKRSLWIECADEAENIMGTDHVVGTIYNINKYAEDKKLLYNWLKEI